MERGDNRKGCRGARGERKERGIGMEKKGGTGGGGECGGGGEDTWQFFVQFILIYLIIFPNQ